MGGFVNAAADIGGDLGRAFAEHLGSVSHVFERTDQGKMILGDIKNIYQPVKAQMVETLSKQALDKAKLDPAAPKVDISGIHTNASKAARHALFGPKDALGVTLVASVEKQHGVAAAQSLSNAIAFVLKDRVDPMAARDVEGAAKVRSGTPFSSFKMNASKAGVGLTDLTPSYNPPGKVERAVTKGIYATFSPLMVVPHIATIINGALGSDPATFLQGLSKPIGRSLSEGVDHFQQLVTTGAFVESNMNAIKEWNTFKATGSSDLLKNPVAKVIYRMVHNPGFSTWRDYNLLSGAHVGKMTAEQLGRDFVKNPADKKLLFGLTQFGLDPKKILEQGGKLDEEDLGRSIYKFVNEHYFLDNSLSRSQLLQSTWAGRVLGTYHGYVTRQSKLMASALGNGFKRGGAVGVAKNLAIMATIMPLFGEGIKTIQETYRGQNAGGDLKRDIDNIQGKHGAEAFAESYFGALGHVGAYGVYGHVLRGSLTHSLLETASGPIGSATADFIQDSAVAARKDYRDKGKHLLKNSKAQARDLMFDTPGISLLAQVLAHRILPNAKDNVHKDPARQLYHHMRGEDDYGRKIEPQDDK